MRGKHNNIRPDFFRVIGFKCNHNLDSNPSRIDMAISKDGITYYSWARFKLEKYSHGWQLFDMDKMGIRYKFIKLIVRDTYGDCKTYLNQVCLLER